jgi:hypothetical protein
MSLHTLFLQEIHCDNSTKHVVAKVFGMRVKNFPVLMYNGGFVHMASNMNVHKQKYSQGFLLHMEPIFSSTLADFGYARCTA